MKIDSAYIHFKIMNYSEDNSCSDTDFEEFEAQHMLDNHDINGPISLKEIQSAVQRLKKKSNGIYDYDFK